MHSYDSGTINDCLLPATVALRDYWLEKQAKAGGVPRYCDVDLMDLYRIAHLLSVKDVINDGEDFSNRYWGTELCRALGFEATGMRVSEYKPEPLRDNLLRRYRSVTQHKTPESRRAEIEHLQHRKFVTYEALHVPFLDRDGNNVSQIMTAFEFNIPLER